MLFQCYHPLKLLSRSRTPGYCWRIYFKVLEILFLASVSQAFLPSKKACEIHKFGTFEFANSIGRVIEKYNQWCQEDGLHHVPIHCWAFCLLTSSLSYTRRV